MLKILQASLQQYGNWELSDAQAGFRKGKGTRYQVANICWIIEKARKFQKYICFCFIDYVKKPLTMWITNYGKFLKRREYKTTLPTSWETGMRWRSNVRTGHGKTDWFRIGKGVRQGCILSPCLFNIYAEYIMWNVGLDESQAGIKIASRISTLHICRWYHSKARK